MKKIAIVAQGLGDGGAEKVASILANYFITNGHSVLFIAAYSPKKEYYLHENIKYTFIDTKYNNTVLKMLSRSIKIKNAINDFEADVAISFIVNEMILCNISKIPIVYSLRNDPANTSQSLIKRYIRLFSYGRAKKIVFQTPGARDYFSRKIRERGVIIGNPLTGNLPFWNKSAHKKTVITACRLAPQKNLKMLITAFSRFHAIHSKYNLEIYGDGPLKGYLENYCEEIGISKHVSILGHNKNIHCIIANSAVFVLTSDYEGLSNAMLEALAIGIPTICTDCPPGGASIYIKNEINGILVPVGNQDELYNELCNLAEDDSLCCALSDAAVEIRNELLDSKICKKWESLL